jgi:choline dehydrogenase
MNADYIIVGAGSAGCVLANRLSEDSNNSVVLLEAGVSDRKFIVQMPLGYALTFNNPALNWMYDTQPEPELDGRSCFWPRGKVMGGSSSINAMVYMRGLPCDFNAWRDSGCEGWGWDDVLPMFKKHEDHQLVANEHHNQGGELHISDVSGEVHPLSELFLTAGTELGYSRTDDFNGSQKEGVGHYQLTSRNGFRASSSNAFLRPIKRRKNLRVITQAHVIRILFEECGDGQNRASGVEYICKGKKQMLTASKEVIISGGAINSPQLLQLSGVGNANLLRKRGIDMQQDVKAVGQHLQDHLSHTHYFKSRVPTLNDTLHPLLGKLKVGLQYLLTRKGILSMSVNQAGAFVRSSPEQSDTDFQLYFNPLTYSLNGEVRKVMNTDPFSAFSLTFNACRPSSEGTIELASADPFDKPLIRPNYLSTEKDLQDAITGNHLLRQLTATPTMQSVIESEISPGPSVSTDAEFLADFRQKAGTIFHPCGSCRMGVDAATSVVDVRLRVHGLKGLRVVDASIFPTIPSGNTNAPSMMVGEKGAQMILEDNR